MYLLLLFLLLAGYVIFGWFLWRETYGLPPLPARARQRLAEDNGRERVLFVCTHNSNRSQMAEALLRQAAGSTYYVASAGTAPTRIHPLAEQVMAERGLSLRSHRTKALFELGDRWDYVITVCDAAYENCPDFPAKTSRLHWSIKDPASAGTAAEQLQAFRRVRDDLAGRIERWVADRQTRA